MYADLNLRICEVRMYIYDIGKNLMIFDHGLMKKGFGGSFWKSSFVIIALLKL